MESKIAKPIPVTLLSGFLGSGKTTLLKYILSENHGFKIAVVINDLASVNIDAKLIQNEKNVAIRQQKETIIQLENGCACCTLRSDLVEQLISLADSGKFDYIIIETSGLSEPMSVAQTFTQEYSKNLVNTYMSQLQLLKSGNSSVDEMTSELKQAYGLIENVIKLGGLTNIARLDTAVTVLDAFNFLNNYESFELATTSDAKAVNETENSSITDLLIQQIEFADVILINKISTIDENKTEILQKIMAIISGLNPQAKVYQTDYCKVDDLGLLLNTQLFNFERVQKMSSWIQSDNLIEIFGNDKLEGKNEEKHTHDNHEQKHVGDLKHGHEHHHECNHDHERNHDHEQNHYHKHNHDGSCCSNDHAHEDNHIKKYGITSFIYTSSKPFHPGRLDRLLRDKYMLIKHSECEEPQDYEDDDDENTSENHEDDSHAFSGDKRSNSNSLTPSKKIKSDMKDEKLPSYPDFTVPSNEELITNKKNSIFKDVIRIKGFIWLATSLLNKCELGGSGQLIRFQSSTPWLNQFTLPFMFPMIQAYKEMKAQESNLSTKVDDDQEIDTSNVFISPGELSDLLSDTSMPKTKIQEILENEFGDASNEIVFIGFNLNRTEIVKELDECLLTEDEMKYFRYIVLDKLGLFKAPGGENEETLQKIGKPAHYVEELKEFELDYEDEEVDIVEIEEFLYNKFGDDYVPFI